MAGRLNGLSGVPGAILGPLWTREMAVIVDCDERGVTVGYATERDLANAIDTVADPRTVTEFKRNVMAQMPVTDRLRELFGTVEGNADAGNR
jgi:hypothetical protein